MKERHHIQDLKPQHDCTFGVGMFCLWRGFGVFVVWGWGGCFNCWNLRTPCQAVLCYGICTCIRVVDILIFISISNWIYIFIHWIERYTKVVYDSCLNAGKWWNYFTRQSFPILDSNWRCRIQRRQNWMWAYFFCSFDPHPLHLVHERFF